MIYLWGFLLIGYIIITVVWGCVNGSEYATYRDKKSARLFLGTLIWPLIVIFYILRLIFQAVGDSSGRKNK